LGVRAGAGLLVGLLAAAAPARAAGPLEFRVTFDPAVSREPFTGRVFVLLSRRNPGQEPPRGVNWFNPDPMFARDVKGWKPGEPLAFGADALAYPAPPAKTPAGTYYATAVMDFGRGISFSASEGNGFSAPVRLDLDPAKGGTVALSIDKVYHERPFPETDRVKLVDIPSKLLTEFHGRPVRLRAAVVLPESFAANPDRRYPVVYEIPGFGGNHLGALRRRGNGNVGGVDMLWVVLDPLCPTGHHVFADSDNNGPCGKALTEELIPEIEKRFRGLGTPADRFVTGHSSGGWSSLWLQVTYPDFFGGVWSTAPDPVTTQAFQLIDLTKPGGNMFADEQGKPRPLARRDGKPVLFCKPFSDMEEVMGHGGQLASFEAVFSPRGSDGRPRRLWDRATGAVDPEVARAWERYDIRRILERDWKTLGPKLAGKLHVYMGGEDTFYLEGATKLLQESLARLGSDAKVEIVPGKDHGTLMDRPMRERIAREMAEQARRAVGREAKSPRAGEQAPQTPAKR
jgi:S-formylglutathione hydrolase FrmB